MKSRFLVLPFTGVAALWVFHMLTHPWTQDEGMYLYFAQNVRDRGELPYVDFAYTQLPLYPFVLAPLIHLFSNPLWVGRGLNLLSFFGILAWAFWRIKKISNSILWGLALILAVGLHPLIWDYMVLAKPYSLCTLLIIGAFEMAQRLTRLNLLFAGILFGLAAGIRTNFGFAVLVFIPMLWLRKKDLALFLLGSVLVNLPTIIFLISDFETVWFNIHRYHELRSHIPPAKQWMQKALTLKTTLVEPISLLVTFSGLVGIFSKKFSKENSRLLFFAFVTTVPLLRLSPYYDEYLVLWITIALIVTVSELSVRISNTWIPIVFGILMVTLFGIRKGLSGLGEDRTLTNSVSQVAEVASFVESTVPKDHEFFTFWSGYAAVSHRKLPHGCDTGIYIREMDRKLKAQEYEKYKIDSLDSIIQSIVHRKYPYVLSGLGSPNGFDELVSHYYGPGMRLPGAVLYARH